jgi:hypothetical protein
MLARKFNRRVAETQRFLFIKKLTTVNHSLFGSSSLLYFFLCLCVCAVDLSCGSKRTELRSLAPADSLIYLETNDLGAALQPIVDSRSFNEAARSKPDISALKGVQVAIAVTGFETTENKISEQDSELNFKPHFVAIADTHTWEWQTRSFAENKLGEFINKVYGGGVQLEISSKTGGFEYVWTAEDGRKAFGFVTGSLVLFGNDESSIEKVQAVRRGEADPISKTGKVPSGAVNLAVGYVSTDGIGQIANIIGAQKAKESGEETEVQSFVARVVPQLLRGAIREASWTAKRIDQGYEDTLALTFDTDIAAVLNETLTASGSADASLLGFGPPDSSVTAYDLKDPQIAWRSLLLSAQKLTDPASGKIISAFSNSFFEPYGVKDGEKFLSAVAPTVITIKYEDEDDVAVIARATDIRKLTESLDPEFIKAPGSFVQIGEAGFENVVLLGNAEVVAKCLQSHQSDQNIRNEPLASGIPSGAIVTTIAYDHDTAGLIADVISEKGEAGGQIARPYTIETRFNKTVMGRRLVSEFGLIGSLIVLLASED